MFKGTAMRSIANCVAAASLFWSASVAAQDSAAPSVPLSSDERRLTPEEVEKVLAEAAAKREKAARPALEHLDEEDAPAVPQVHGEVGFGIGTGGYREAYGAAIYGLGNDASAAISLDFVDSGKRRFEHQAPPPFILR
jgi:hypothetical protein